MVDSQLTLVTQAAFARMRGVSRQAVHKAIAAGKLSTHGPRKMVDAGSAVAELDASVSRVQEVLLDDGPKPAIKPDSLTALRARTEEERGLLLRLEREQREGRLVEREQVDAEHETAARLVRRALDTIPSRAEDILAAAKGGLPAVRGVLKALIRDVETTLAHDMLRAAEALEAERAVDENADDE